jgi:hypothetical protein
VAAEAVAEEEAVVVVVVEVHVAVSLLPRHRPNRKSTTRVR